MAKQKQNEDPMAEDFEALKVEAIEAPKMAQPSPVATVAEPASTENSLVASLMATISAMQAQIASLQTPAGKPKKDFGPPPPARKNRPHIMVFVKPDTCVRTEVPQSYIDNKQPGWDGTPVKGYANHAATIRGRRR